MARKLFETARSTPKSGSKSAKLVQLLRRERGASLADLVKATGWLPHTTRAALTGLRKKGHVIARDKRSGETRYRIQAGS
jgi:DNA-binding IclR family transcriptional regulator